jgi:hypothetical protein
VGPKGQVDSKVGEADAAAAGEALAPFAGAAIQESRYAVENPAEVTFCPDDGTTERANVRIVRPGMPTSSGVSRTLCKWPFC